MIKQENPMRSSRAHGEPIQGSSFPLFLDALLLVSSGIHVKVEVIPLITGWERDGLAEGEAHSIDYSLASGLTGTHADRRGTTWGPEEMGR